MTAVTATGRISRRARKNSPVRPSSPAEPGSCRAPELPHRAVRRLRRNSRAVVRATMEQMDGTDDAVSPGVTDSTGDAGRVSSYEAKSDPDPDRCSRPSWRQGQRPRRTHPPRRRTCRRRTSRSGRPASRRQIKWTFNFDAGWGTFGFANSLFDNPKEPGVEENLSDQWFEGYVKPALSASYTLGLVERDLRQGQRRRRADVRLGAGRRSGRTSRRSGPRISRSGGDRASRWRLGENALDFSVGRAQYRLGHGFLLFDGAAEGGSRGGYWTNARKAFEFAAIGRFKPGAHTVEAFYLDKDELDESDSGSRLWGANYEYSIGETTTLGATYMKWFADAELKPGRDGLNVFNVRAYTAPLAGRARPVVRVRIRVGTQRRGARLQRMDAPGRVRVQRRQRGSRRSRTATRSSRATTRHTPPTRRSIRCSSASTTGAPGGRARSPASTSSPTPTRPRTSSARTSRRTTPIGGGLLFFKFRLDHPRSFGPGVTDKDVAFEIDALRRLEGERELHGQRRRRLRRSREGRAAGDRPHQELPYGMVYVAYSF